MTWQGAGSDPSIATLALSARACSCCGTLIGQRRICPECLTANPVVQEIARTTTPSEGESAQRRDPVLSRLPELDPLAVAEAERIREITAERAKRRAKRAAPVPTMSAAAAQPSASAKSAAEPTAKPVAKPAEGPRWDVDPPRTVAVTPGRAWALAVATILHLLTLFVTALVALDLGVGEPIDPLRASRAARPLAMEAREAIEPVALPELPKKVTEQTPVEVPQVPTEAPSSGADSADPLQAVSTVPPESPSRRHTGIMRDRNYEKRRVGMGGGAGVAGGDADGADNGGGEAQFFGATVTGNVVLILDRSASMSMAYTGDFEVFDADGKLMEEPTRLDAVKSEATKLLRGLTEDARFAVVSFGGEPELENSAVALRASPANVAREIDRIWRLRAHGPTPAWSALKAGLSRYRLSVRNVEKNTRDSVFFLTDGAPNYDSGAPNGEADGPTILQAFPGWFKPHAKKDLDFVAICMDDAPSAVEFCTALAKLAGGRCLAR